MGLERLDWLNSTKLCVKWAKRGKNGLPKCSKELYPEASSEAMLFRYGVFKCEYDYL
jgi:hypothetical protein